MLIKCIRFFCIAVAFIAVYFPARHARRYSYISKSNIVKEIVLNSPQPSSDSLKYCRYEDIILNNEVFAANDILKPYDFLQPSPGGWFVPKHCKPLIKTAVIVPYRNRSTQLQVFVNYMHQFLQHQNIHYRIIVVEQSDSLPFNRAKMINFGARFAIDANYTCLILHDVDLIPLASGNLYGCSRRPRHMSSSLDTFRYNLPYLTLFGGAISILSDQYKSVNGMSNSFYGWGGEDDDFYSRLEINNLEPYRFEPEISKYTMLVHKKEPKNGDRFKSLQRSLENLYDGLNTLPRKYSIFLEDLFTKVVCS